MKRTGEILFIFLSLIVIVSCDEDTDKDKSYLTCDQEVIISSELFNTAPNDALTINSINIDGNCMLINFSSSGCSGDTWTIKLIDSGSILVETSPPERTLRLSLDNEEICDAYILKNISFDISNLQVAGSNQVSLKITNNDSKITYNY